MKNKDEFRRTVMEKAERYESEKKSAEEKDQRIRPALFDLYRGISYHISQRRTEQFTEKRRCLA